MAASPAAFRKVGNRVELSGMVSGGTAPTVFVLPEGYRPSSEMQFSVAAAGGASIVTVKPDGSVDADYTEVWVNLDGISFTVTDD